MCAAPRPSSVTTPSPLHAFQTALLGFLRQGGSTAAPALADAVRGFARQRPRPEAGFWAESAAFYDDLASAQQPPDEAQRLWSTRLERQMRRSLRGNDLDPELERELTVLRAAQASTDTTAAPPLPPQLAALAGLLGRTLDPLSLAAWNAAGSTLQQAWNGGIQPDWNGLRQGGVALCAAATRLASEQPDTLALAVALADALDRQDGVLEPAAEVRATLSATLEAFAEDDAPARPGFADRVAHLVRRLEAITRAPARRVAPSPDPERRDRPFGSLAIAAEFAAEAAERLAELREALHRYPPDRHALALGAAELAEDTANHGLSALAEIARLLSRAVDFGAPDLESATVRARLESALDGMSGQLDEVADDCWPTPLPRLAAALAAFVGERS